jgi:YD repeat-containing protein
MMTRRTVALLFLLAVLSTIPAIGQQPPERERGFKADGVYQFKGFDSVQLLNGNLNLTIPIAEYPVSADVSYSFVIRHAGQVWTSFDDEEGIGPIFPPPPPVWSGFRWFAQRDNAGMGWQVGFGELIAPSEYEGAPTPALMWRYRSPDRSEHFFYDTLHEPRCVGSSTNTCDGTTTGVWYTRDGTYLRMKGDETAKVIEFPNGQRHRFLYDAPSDEWRLQYIYGASSQLNNDIPTTNWVKIDYEASTTHTGVVDWQITDSHGRDHDVFFQPTLSGVAIVDRIRVAAFPLPGNASADHAEYNFTYDDYTINGSGNPVDGSFSAIAKPCNGLPPTNASVRLLRRIDFPSGELWQFEYNDLPHDELTTGCDNASGTLKQATLPTLGTINWTYQDYPLTSDVVVGVASRVLKDPSNNEVERTIYTPGDATTIETQVKNSSSQWVADSKIVNYFDLTQGPTFGLPYNSAMSDGTSTARKLSSEIFDCNPETGMCWSERKSYVKYEMDDVGLPGQVCNILDDPCGRDRNRRVVSERTLFVTDANHYVDTDYSLFDGLGHYRQTNSSSNISGTTSRETYTGFNLNTLNYNASTWAGSSVGTYSLNSSGARVSGFTMLHTSDSWILNTFSSAYSQEGPVTARVQACFDPTTGFLHRKRMLKGNLAGANDLLSVRTYDTATGYASRDESFGGDLQTAGTSSLCTMALPAHDQYSFRTDYTYQYGVLKTARAVNASTQPPANMPFYAVENSTIDRNTSLVTESKDTAEVATSYVYDHSGRLTSVAPTGAASTTYVYTNVSASTSATVEVTTGSGTTGTEQVWLFDPFGRVSIEKQRMPDGTWSARKTTYDTAGRRESVSELETMTGSTMSPVHTTVFSKYDPFGRVGSITAPDGSKTEFSYVGDRLKTRISRIWTGVDGDGQTPGDQDTAVSVTEQYDGRGRLIAVTENSGPVGGSVTTTYGYDVGDRLTAVKMAGSEGTIQNRFFDYDGRGFLRWESHPESGMKSYAYDARGHVRSMNQSAARTPFDLKYTYDAAERLTGIEGRDPANLDLYRPIKVFAFATANDDVVEPDDKRKGKLLSATRYNYPGPLFPYEPTLRVVETYAYQDAAGRLTTRKTDVIDDTPGAFTYPTVTQEVSYNNLGLPDVMKYPVCEDCGLPSSNPNRPITYSYTRGRLTSLSDFVTGITVWPNGMRRDMTHSNSMIDKQTVDPSGMARPGTLWSGQYNVCTPPTILQRSAGGVISSTNPSVTLSVIAGGTGPFTYAWYVSGVGVAIAGETSSSLTISPTTETIYQVRVANECGMITAGMTVKVGECVTPWVASKSATRNADGTFNLAATAAGTGSFTYQWYRLADNSSVGTGATAQTEVLSETTEFQIKVTSSSCGTGTAEVTASVPLASPTNLLATLTGTNQITVAWSASAGASSYKVRRRTAGLPWQAVSTVTAPTTQIVDSGLSSGRTYAYQVVAILNGESPPSNADLATTMTFTSVQSEMPVRAATFDELLIALNAMRTAAGWATVGWSNILAPSDPLVELDEPITSKHILALRARMNEAAQALGVSTGGYTDPDLSVVAVSKQHVIDLQNKAK